MILPEATREAFRLGSRSMMAAGQFQFRAVLQLIAGVTDDPIKKEEGFFIQATEPDAGNAVVVRQQVFLEGE